MFEPCEGCNQPPNQCEGAAQCYVAKRVSKAYQRGVEEERERCAKVAEEMVCGYGSKSDRFFRRVANAIRTASPAPQKNTAECQEVCRWTYTGSCAFKTDCEQDFVYEDKEPPAQCPACGRTVTHGFHNG